MKGLNDITKYSDNELSLIVMNNEVLYKWAINRQFKDLHIILDTTYKYTEKQWEQLSKDVANEIVSQQRG